MCTTVVLVLTSSKIELMLDTFHNNDPTINNLTNKLPQIETMVI